MERTNIDVCPSVCLPRRRLQPTTGSCQRAVKTGEIWPRHGRGQATRVVFIIKITNVVMNKCRLLDLPDVSHSFRRKTPISCTLGFWDQGIERRVNRKCSTIVSTLTEMVKTGCRGGQTQMQCNVEDNNERFLIVDISCLTSLREHHSHFTTSRILKTPKKVWWNWNRTLVLRTSCVPPPAFHCLSRPSNRSDARQRDTELSAARLQWWDPHLVACHYRICLTRSFN